MNLVKHKVAEASTDFGLRFNRREVGDDGWIFFGNYRCVLDAVSEYRTQETAATVSDFGTGGLPANGGISLIIPITILLLPVVCDRTSVCG